MKKWKVAQLSRALDSDIFDYLGAVNHAPWRDGDARTWLCASLSLMSIGGQFRLTWKFIHNPSSWDIRLNKSRTFRGYKEKDFSALGL